MVVSAKNCPLPSASTKIRSQITVVTDLQYTCKEFKVEIRNEALCPLGKWAEQIFRSQIFSETDFTSPILASPHI